MASVKQRQTEQEKTISGAPTGFNQHFIKEKVNILRQTNTMVVNKNNHGAFVILKRDGDQSLASGAGGRGYTECAAIDLVTGLDSSNGQKGEERDPNFFTDASRVYITQKGKISRYMGTSRGSSIGQERWSSAVGIKSDNVNITGRRHIKITTGAARIGGQERNSQGGEIDGAGKIDLIAGNYSGTTEIKSLSVLGFGGSTKRQKALQAVPKGDNLLNLLNEILEKISDVHGFTLDNKRAIIEVATSYASHIHPGVCAVGPVITTPTPMALAVLPTIATQFAKIPETVLGTINLANLRENFLNPNFPDYINSKNVSTT